MAAWRRERERESYVEYNYPKAKQKSQDGASMTTATQEGKTGKAGISDRVLSL